MLKYVHFGTIYLIDDWLAIFIQIHVRVSLNLVVKYSLSLHISISNDAFVKLLGSRLTAGLCSADAS